MKIDTSALVKLGETNQHFREQCSVLRSASEIIVECFDRKDCLFMAGNGGSMSDALHISGELKKRFKNPRPLDSTIVERLASIPGGQELVPHLEVGFRVQVLGSDPVFLSAMDNDVSFRHLGFAQDLLSSGRSGDVLLAISTSGKSRNILNALVVAKALNISAILLTGPTPPESAVSLAKLTITTPPGSIGTIQNFHSSIYHAICQVIDDTFFSK